MKFKHDDDREVALPERTPAKYDDVMFPECEVRLASVYMGVEHYRTTLLEAGYVVDERCFALGLLPEDLDCEHEVTESPDRFGAVRCSRCTGWLWSAAWVAEGVMGEETIEYAYRKAIEYADRLPKLRVVRR